MRRKTDRYELNTCSNNMTASGTEKQTTKKFNLSSFLLRFGLCACFILIIILLIIAPEEKESGLDNARWNDHQVNNNHIN